jgi:TctA family transporter
MVTCGVVAGLLVGVIPGIGGIFGMALLIPLTYNLDPYAAFALLLGMGSVTTTSDTIPAVLFGVPGTVGAAATVLDGHAMAKKGEAARALGAAYSASLIGGVFGALVLAASIPIIRPLILLLKTPDFFAISAFGLSIVAMLAGSQPLKGVAAAMLGLLLSFVGIDDLSGFDRWTFGEVYFWEGLPIVVVFLALFGLPELGGLLVRGAVAERSSRPGLAGMSRGVMDTLREWPLVLRCSSMGAFLGALPGIGVAVVDWIAYGHAARRPGTGPPFGQGNVRGVIAPESANNAKEGGSLIPTIAFGVPGSASMGLLLGAFVIQGLIPGPDMLGKNASVTIAMVFTIAAANVLGALICLVLTRPLASIARIPAGLVIPVVVTFIVVGSFQNNASALDFAVLVALGLLGMAMKELNWPRSAFALGFVLGPTLEKYFFLSYQIAGWSWLTHPLVVAILGVGVANVLRQTFRWWRARGQPMLRPGPVPDALLAGAVAIVALAAFATAIRFPPGAGLFPSIAAGLLALVCVPVAARAVWRIRHVEPASLDPAAVPPGEWSPSSGPILRAYAVILGSCIALALAILAGGHLVGSFVFLLIALLVARSRPPIMAPIVAAGVTLVLVGIFDVLASQPWPRPWLAALADVAWR